MKAQQTSNSSETVKTQQISNPSETVKTQQISNHSGMETQQISNPSETVKMQQISNSSVPTSVQPHPLPFILTYPLFSTMSKSPSPTYTSLGLPTTTLSNTEHSS